MSRVLLSLTLLVSLAAPSWWAANALLIHEGDVPKWLERTATVHHVCYRSDEGLTSPRTNREWITVAVLGDCSPAPSLATYAIDRFTAPENN